MVRIAPRPFLIGAAFYPLTGPVAWIIKTVPVGAWFRLKYLLISYPTPDPESGADFPNLSYELFDADGRAFGVAPIMVGQVTSPGIMGHLGGVQMINVDYPGGTSLKLKITGALAGEPATVSVTFAGMRGWESLGGGFGG